MISAESIIQRFRRDLTLSALARVALIGAATAVLLLGQFMGAKTNGPLFLMLIGGVWLVLSYRSMKGSRGAAYLPSLIASGQFEEAEQQIDGTLRTFSLFRTPKLLGLHHLAILRHAQRRWQESAALSQALLGQRLGALSGLSKPARLILADALLELGDLRGAYAAMEGLYRHRLNLPEAMNLLTLQLDYLSRIGAWEAMMQGVGAKMQLAELMPTESAARTQALLSLAAQKTQRNDLAHWLRRRAELLCDVKSLVAERPVLREVWSAAA